jgi:hypothetical protein
MIYKLILSTLIALSVHAVTGNILHIKGHAFINKNKASKGDTLKANDILRTIKKSLVVIKLSDGSIVKVNSSSHFSIDNHQSKTKVTLKQGSAFFYVLKNQMLKYGKQVSKFDVKTKTAAMGVRGTTFFVSATDSSNNYDTWMCVNEGLVEISKLNQKGGKSKKLVKAGEGIKIASNEKVDDPRPLPWTKNLNWNIDLNKDLENKVDIKDAYLDILDQDYE